MTDSTHHNNKRIAKNTMLLYFRMILTMLVALYTSRVVLNTLGIEDFGILNVVGGVVALFSFLSSTMSTAASRFLSYEIGKQNSSKLVAVFSSSVLLHVVAAIVVLLLSESVGYFLLVKYLVIPEVRMAAAKVVFHISILIVCVGILKVPYVALIISREKMGVFALFEIIAVFLKLFLVIMLQYFTSDKLVLYSYFLLCVETFLFLLYFFYNYFNHLESRVKLIFEKKVIMPILSFVGWDFYGNASVVLRTQGVNILLNVFYGPVMNTASGIASQVQSAISSFSSNILVAVRPQIVKSYSSDNILYTLYLLNNTIKFTTILLFIIIAPVFIELDYVYTLWLKSYPDYTVSFSRLTMVFIIIANISSVVISVIHATGRVKKTSFVNGTLYLFVFPITYFSFRYGGSPVIPFILNALFVALGSILNMCFLQDYLKQFSIVSLLRTSVFPTLLIGLLGLAFIYSLTMYVSPSFFKLILMYVFSVLIYLLLSYSFLLDKDLKKMILFRLFKILKK